MGFKKNIFLLLIFVVSLFSPIPILASSNLEVAKDNNFTNQRLNFTPGETIYVRIFANNDGSDKSQLNLRDNLYNLIQTYEFSKLGNNQFATSILAPNSEGYYSLETQIESDGSVSKSVKTIKVGSPESANIKVNVKSEVAGQSVTLNNSSPSLQTTSEEQTQTQNSVPKQENQQELLDNPDINFNQESQNQETVRVLLAKLLLKFIRTLWPF